MTQQVSDLAGFARERLEAALSGLLDDASDGVVVGAAEEAVMALRLLYGSTDPVLLDPVDVLELINSPELTCSCPPELVARGGYQSACSADHG